MEELFHAIFDNSMSGIDNVGFSVSVAATIVAKARQLSTSYKSFMGVSNPNSFISVEVNTKEELQSII